MIDTSANAVAFLASALFCTSVVALTAWRRRELLAGLVAAMAGAFTLVLVGLNLANGQDIDRYQIGVAAVPGLLAASLLFVFDSIGLPDWLAERLGIGLRDPRARFYEKLRVPWRQVNAEMEAGRSEPHGRYSHLRKASSLVDWISGLEAPTSDWRELRDDVVRCQRAWIELARKNRDPERWPARPHAYPLLTERFQGLAEEIAGEHGLTLEEYRLRNGRLRRLAVVSAVLVALPGLAVTWPPNLVTNEWFWLELCGLYACVLPMLGLTSSAVGWLRRRFG